MHPVLCIIPPTDFFNDFTAVLYVVNSMSDSGATVEEDY